MLARRDLRGVVSRDRSTAGELGGTRSADAGAMVVWMGGTGGYEEYWSAKGAVMETKTWGTYPQSGPA